MLQCTKRDGRLVYAALVEAARLTRLRSVYVLGIDESSISAYLDYDDASNAPTVLAATDDWKVVWSSKKSAELTRAQERHVDSLFAF
jgi:hypothetical protein